MMRQLTVILLVMIPLIVAVTLWLDEPASNLKRRPSQSTPPAKRETRTEPLGWGLYQIHWGRRFPQMLKQELANFTSQPQYVMFYRDLGRPYPQRGIDAIYDTGATPMISLELWMWGNRNTDQHLPAINAGKYDTFFRRWATAARDDGRRVLLRFGFEMNGDWFSWSLDPPAFISAWRRIKTIFDDAGAENVEWVWSPNVVSIPRTDENDMHRYYPGNTFVDWVSLDGYNFGDHHSEWHQWESFRTIYEKPLAALIEKYPSKPIIISEFGSAPGKPGQKARWIREAYDYLTECPQVKAAIWFNLDKRSEGEPNWRIDECESCLEAFNETFARSNTKGEVP